MIDLETLNRCIDYLKKYPKRMEKSARDLDWMSHSTGLFPPENPPKASETTWRKAKQIVKSGTDYIPPSKPEKFIEWKDRPGFVYLIKSPSGHYKIGKTSNIHNRLRTFNVKLPFEPTLVHTIKSSDMHAQEQVLHQRFASQRVNGEWFNLSDEDVAYIKTL
jgi:hypothetical protein